MKRFLITLALACAFSAPLAAQVEPSTPPDIPAADDTTLDESLKDLERDRAFQRGDRSAARLALEGWASCVARKNASEARRVLSMDFTTATYGRAIRMLAEEDKACMGFRGKMRAGGLLFAGEMAEALLESEGPVASALARAASGPATTAFSFTDKVAVCVVRSVPNEVASLFATARNSDQEAAALRSHALPRGMCARAAEAKKPLEVSPSGLRAMLATAAFRTVAGMKAG